MHVESYLLIIISQLLESVCVCPKVIPLRSYNCLKQRFSTRVPRAFAKGSTRFEVFHLGSIGIGSFFIKGVLQNFLFEVGVPRTFVGAERVLQSQKG